MNAVEIEEAISPLAEHKVKFIVATDGQDFQAESLGDGETVACEFEKFANHFGFFLPLAGITTVKEIRENSFDIKATNRLNKLYLELLKNNPEWATPERRHDLNHFMARLIFCFFAEDTDIFVGGDLFTSTVEQMSASDSSNTHEIIATLFRAMKSPAASTQKFSERPYRFVQILGFGKNFTIAVAGVSSESRQFLPVDLLGERNIVSNLLFGIYDAPLWNMALIASRLHWVWIGTVCVRMRTDFSYSNTLGWNTFPVPPLTAQNKADLTRCAEDILLAREAHFPATIADLYKPDAMPANLRAAHDRNDETLERIYLGRRFKNDTERLEHLFTRYTEMTAKAVS